MKRGWFLDGIPRQRDQKRRQIAITIIAVMKMMYALSGGPRSGSAEVAALVTEDILRVGLCEFSCESRINGRVEAFVDQGKESARQNEVIVSWVRPGSRNPSDN